LRLAFAVEGIPKTKGSMKALRRGSRVVVINDSERTGAWEARIRVAARAAARSVAFRPLSGPVCVSVTFRLPRPVSSIRRDGTPRARADLFPVKKRSGDLDKLQRPVLDALTGIAWEDDAQVIAVAAQKTWANREKRPGVEIEVVEAADVVAAGGAA
jgi:crossover junction endodeoxyribonuclease RusA